MGKKSKILKLLLVILCLCAIMLYALLAAGVNVPFIYRYTTNFKNNVTGISNLLGINLPEEVQIYLAEDSLPAPKPTMMPAAEAEALEEALGYDQPGIVSNEDATELTVKATNIPAPIAKNEILPVALDSASNAKFAEYGGDMVCVSETMYRGYDKKGKVLWEVPIQMQDPHVTVRGKYVLINETGAKKVQLYKGDKKLFDASSYGNIISADLSKKGDVVLVTEKTYYKGEVLVLNKHGEIIFAWAAGSYDILDADISPKRKVAISLLNTDSGADSIITCFDVNGNQKYKTETFKDSIIFELEFDGEKLNAVADNRCIGISARGKTSWEYSFDKKTLMDYDIAENGSKLFLLENNGAGELVVVSAGGKSYDAIKPQQMPNTISIKSDYIAYNSGRDVVVSDFKGKTQRKASCGSDIKKICNIDKDEIFCVYSSSIQVKKLIKIKK